MQLMSRRLSDIQIQALAVKNDYSFRQLKAIILVESGGIGFSEITGKILIQFEPTWFERKYADWKNHQAGHTWQNNGVDNQAAEWKAFNDAFSINANAAMQATSIGMMQVMGFHYSELGFENVGAMWDYAKESEANQVELAIRFIKRNPKLDQALKNNDWATVAYYYNGSGYKKYNYDIRLQRAYNTAKNPVL
jgi:hypothetical protein